MLRSFNVIGSDAEEKPESEELKKIGVARRNCLVVHRREAEPKVEIMSEFERDRDDRRNTTLKESLEDSAIGCRKDRSESQIRNGMNAHLCVLS